MPQPQSLPVQHQNHPKQANYQHQHPTLAEPQPQPLQLLGQPSSSSSPQPHQEWQQHAVTDQEIQQNQEEEQSHAQPPPSVANYAPSATQINGGRKISCKDIQLVQNLIEQCLQLYMNQGEVINTLLNKAKIERNFTSLVWQKLEEQNPVFFKAYYTRLKLKKQIMLFNYLLEQQADLMHKMRLLPKSVSMQAFKNVHELPLDYPTKQQTCLTAEGHPSVQVLPEPTLPSGRSSVQDDCHIPHDSLESNCLMDVISEVSPAMQQSSLAISSDESPDSASVVPNSSTFSFAASRNPMEISMNISHPAPLPLYTSFSTRDPNSQNALVSSDTDRNNVREVLGSLGQLPRNFSLSDLTAELDPDSDLGPFGNYSSPFLTPDAEVFDFGIQSSS